MIDSDEMMEKLETVFVTSVAFFDSKQQQHFFLPAFFKKRGLYFIPNSLKHVYPIFAVIPWHRQNKQKKTKTKEKEKIINL
jgi:uncharacterized membrane protein